MDKKIRVLRKYYEFFLTKLVVLKAQKYFKSKGVRYKYLLEENESDVLVVVLSSCTRPGLRARYNYVRTLKPLKLNKLFILDDFAKDHRGSFYLGKNMKFNEEEAALDLIYSIISQTNAKKVIFCGSSKGGWSALNFALQVPGSYAVLGGPSYFLGDWLVRTNNIDTYKHIAGEMNDTNRQILNEYLPGRVNNCPDIKDRTVYMHYSVNDWTYEGHMKYMIKDFKRLECKLIEDVQNYKDHSEISLYFPEFLVNSIKDIL